MPLIPSKSSALIARQIITGFITASLTMDVQDVHGENTDLQVLAKLERLAKTTVLHVLLAIRVTTVLLLVAVAFCAL